jgi:hypothetical protein
VESAHFHESFGEKPDAPGVLTVESRLPSELTAALSRRGHRIQVVGDYDIATAGVAVGVDPQAGTLRGAADVRGARQVFGW